MIWLYLCNACLFDTETRFILLPRKISFIHKTILQLKADSMIVFNSYILKMAHKQNVIK